MPRHQLLGSSNNCRIVTEAGEPVYEGLLAEPGELPFGVAARGLGNGFRGGCQGDGAFQVGLQFAVSDEVEWLRILGNAAADKAGNFLEPAAIEHGVDSPLDAVVERGARGLQTDLDRVIAFEGRAARPVNFRERTSREQTNFDRANHFRPVAGTDPQ